MSSIETKPFVRTGDLLTEQAPPANETGAIAWVRANLFGSVTDSIISVVLGIVIVWMLWSAISGMLLQANWQGKTQGEGVLAGLMTGLDGKVDEARAMEANAEQSANDNIARIENDMAALAALVDSMDLDALPQETRLGATNRVLPFPVSERLKFLKDAVPLSRYFEIEIYERQLKDTSLTEKPGHDALMLTEAEKAYLFEASQPWFRISPTQQEAYRTAKDAMVKVVNTRERTDEGRVLLPLDQVRAQVAEQFATLEAPAEQLLFKPTRPARKFNELVDTLAAMPITTVPESRIIKMRKDIFGSDNTQAYRATLAAEMVAETQPDLQGRALTQAIDELDASLTDADLFLNEQAPDYAGFEDPLYDNLRGVLNEINFWAAARPIVNATFTPEQLANDEALLVVEKAENVLALLEGGDAPTGAYADATRDLLRGYLDQDLDGIDAALDGYAPLVEWSSTRDGANWAVVVDDRDNWSRMLIGKYSTNKVWKLFKEDSWQLNDEIWRVWAVTIGLIIALLPLFVPACRNRYLITFSVLYPLFLLLMLSGFAVRFYGFKGPEEAGFWSYLFSQQGRLILAAVLIVYIVVAQFVRTRTAFGTTAGPALAVSKLIGAFAIILCLWGNVFNPEFVSKQLLYSSYDGMGKPVGMLTLDHPLGERDEFNPDAVQAEMDRLTALAAEEGTPAEEASAARIRAQELRTDRRAAETNKAQFESIIEEGRGTFIIIPHVPALSHGGLLVTMILGTIGIIMSLPIGIVLAFGRQSTLPIVRWFSTTLIEGIRGVPLVALLLLVVFVLPKMLPPGTEFPGLILALIAICIFGGVYMAEVIRGGLQSLPKGQYEASQAMGLTFWQESRLITLPQALKAVIPAIVNTFIGLFKDTTLVIVVSILDLLYTVNGELAADKAWNATKLELLGIVAVIFFALMFSLSRYSIWLEKRLATGHR